MRPGQWGGYPTLTLTNTNWLYNRPPSPSSPSLSLQEAVDEVMDKLQSLPKKDHLVPLFINAETGKLRPGTLTLGARADTYYEYLFKQWLQSSKTEPK